jgi:hypothetical protein
MAGNPQLELDMPVVEGGALTTARFVPRVGEELSRSAPIQFNFSPSVVFAGTRFVLASTEGLARELATARIESAQPGVNTHAALDVPTLRELLADNVSHLVAQNMLKEGRSQAEAARQIELLLGILDVLHDVRLTLSVGEDQLSLDFGLRLRWDE